MARNLVFLSSPGDLFETRQSLAVEFGRWNNARGQTDLETRTYLWESDAVLRELNEFEPIQAQIVRTDGDEVLLTVGMFGERCGVPLVAGAELGRDLSAWKNGDFRLLHPWPTDIADIDKALRDRCFPLTGTIFEQLCAIDAATEDKNRQKPCIGFVANCDISPETNLDDVVFNGFLHNDRSLIGKSPAERRLLTQSLERQRRGLLNYLNALRQSHRIELRRFDSAEEMQAGLLEQIQKVVENHSTRPDGTAGYRNGLTYYDIRDTYPLPGLQEEADEYAQKFWNDAFGNGAGPKDRTLLLCGPSGCGKSSYMRRGILGSLVNDKKKNTIAIAFRPNDLDPHGSGNCLWLLWRLIQGSDTRLKTNFVMDPDKTEMSGEAARALTTALADIEAKLLLGIDQFEEFLDILFRQSKSSSAENRLRSTFAFLRACLDGGRVAIVATLETQRNELRKKFAAAEYGWQIDQPINLELNEQRVRKIVDAPLRAAGLTPDSATIEKIALLWSDFAKEADKTVSTLPLLGLWLARLQDKYRHLAQPKGKAVRDEFGRAGDEPVLNLGHIEGMDPMEGLIDELASSAWHDIGRTFAGAMTTVGGRSVPDKASLNGFLQPFVGLSFDGQKELRDTARHSAPALISAMIERFIKLRLAVPTFVENREMVRLAHQAVIDRWRAAAKWFEESADYLKIERKVLRRAQSWHEEGRAALSTVPESEIDQAAQVLDMLKGSTLGVMSRDNALLRDYAIEVFRHSSTPVAPVPHSLQEARHIHIAATYDLSDLIEGWMRVPGTNARAVANCKNKDGKGPLMAAAFASPASVAVLLREDATVKEPDRYGFHPIAACIQSGREDILDQLISSYGIDEAIAKDGRTMLHQAAQSGQLGILRSLIAMYASPDAPGNTGRTPLYYAAEEGHLEIINELRAPQRVQARTTEEDGAWRAVDVAAINGKWKALDLLLNTPGLTDEARETLLRPRAEDQPSLLGLAVGNLRPGTVRWLLSRKDIDPRDECHLLGNTFGNLAQLAAARASQDLPSYDQRLADTLKVLLDDGRVDPAKLGKDVRPLHQLVAHTAAPARLVNAHPRCPRDWTALTAETVIKEIPKAHMEEILRILQNRPDIILREKDVLSAISATAWPSVAPVLAARVNFGSDEGPRFIAALAAKYPFSGDNSPKTEVKAALFRQLFDQIDARSRDTSGGPLLSLVTESGTAEQLRELLAKNVPFVSTNDSFRVHPAHIAARRGDVGMFEDLAKALHLSTVPRDGWGRRPSDVAAKPDRARIRALEDQYFSSKA